MWCLDLIMEHYVVAITVYKAVRFPTIERYRYR